MRGAAPGEHIPSSWEGPDPGKTLLSPGCATARWGVAGKQAGKQIQCNPEPGAQLGSRSQHSPPPSYYKETRSWPLGCLRPTGGDEAVIPGTVEEATAGGKVSECGFVEWGLCCGLEGGETVEASHGHRC